MTHQELMDALRREGEEKIQAIWRDTEAEAEKLRQQALRRLEELREECRERQALAIEEQAGAVLEEAERRAGLIRLVAEQELAERLWRLARRSLPRLRKEGYGEVFAVLVGELPPGRWQSVKVNPADLEKAKEHFPEVDILPDSAVSGGLAVTGEGAGVRIINTFEKRLERGWAEILPGLLKDIYGKISGHGTSARG